MLFRSALMEFGFDNAYISKYSPRPGTPASRMKDNVSSGEKKRRERILRQIIKNGKKKKLVVILGPTASGKTKLSLEIAKKFNRGKFGGAKGAEIVSADSRQVYKGMDIGTGKIKKEEMEGVAHYLLDVASPKRRFSAAQYQKRALKAIKKIISAGK